MFGRFFLFLALFCALASAASAQSLSFLDDEAEPSFNLSGTLEKGAGAFRLAFDLQDEKNFYALDADAKGASFSLVQNGQKTVLANAPIAWKAKNSVVLQRRPYLMQLLVDGEVALRAFDATWNEGQIGLGSGAWKWTQSRVQPLEEVRFDDDFTRAGTDGGDTLWNTSGGKWELTSASELVNARNAAMSANPFGYQVQSPNSTAFAHGGRWFWDSYDVRAAVKPESGGTIGVAAYVQDPQNYLAFEWSNAESAGARRLVRVQNGKTTVLASGKGAFVPHQWYRIGLRLSPGYIEALMDDIPVLRAQTESFGQGGVGLLAKNVAQATFDDVRVRSYDFLRADFAANGAWKPQSGDWKLGGGYANGSAPNNAARVLLTGAGDWDGYRAFVSSRPRQNQGFGFVVGWRDPKNFTSWRVQNGRQKIIQTANGADKTLFDAPADFKNDAWKRFQLTARGGVVSVESDGEVLAQAVGKNLTEGRFGLWSAGAESVAFSDAVIFFPPPPEPLKAAPKMEDDAYMVGWASPTGEWPPTSGPNGLEFWNVGEFFGDGTWSFPWRERGRGSLEMAIRAKRGEFASGYLLKVENADDKQVTWTLSRGEKTLASATTPQPAEEPTEETPVEVRLSGASLLVSLPDGPVLSYVDENPPSGTAVAIRTRNFRLSADKLLAASSHRDDTMFTEAPSEFYSLSGDWRVISRWPCKGDWSFFGGRGYAPVLWSKRTYSGDVVAQMYAHPQMDLPKDPGYSHPGDLNIALGGDGRDLSSAYNFVVAGNYNTVSQIRRGSTVVASRSDGPATFAQTHNRHDSWHRKWFAIRAEARHETRDGKDGVHLTLFLDDKQLLDWFDPNPLPGIQKGRVAMWTLDSTMTIARARIEAEEFGLPVLPTDLPQVEIAARPSGAAWWPVPVEDAGRPTASVTKSGDGWQISNPMSGNLFAADFNNSPVKATPDTKWSAEFALPENVKVDMYLQIGDDWHLIELNGEQKPDGLAPLLGKAKRDGNKFSFDIGAALQKAMPNQQEWTIDHVRVGVLHGNPYRWAGLDGNPLGASYKVSDWNWSG